MAERDATGDLTWKLGDKSGHECVGMRACQNIDIEEISP